MDTASSNAKPKSKARHSTKQSNREHRSRKKNKSDLNRCQSQQPPPPQQQPTPIPEPSPVKYSPSMSHEEADEVLAAALAQIDIECLPPRLVAPSQRRTRWSSRKALIPTSPHQLIDGRVVRSSLHLNRKRAKRVGLRFPDHEIAGSLEPENPWIHRKHLKVNDVIFAYKEACAKHKVSPLQSVIFKLKEFWMGSQSTKNITDRIEEISFKDQILQQNDCEALEEVFRRILFFKVDLEGAIADDNSAAVLFQIFEFYEATSHLVLSHNQMIGTYGWQACSQMLRKTESLKQLDAVDVRLTEEYMTILTRGLRYSYLIILRFDSCKLTGRTLQLLVIALKFNMALRQLYLCDNGIHGVDCFQIEMLLKFNSRISLLDLSDNQIDDESLYYVINGLTHQLHFGKFSKSKKGLEHLSLWNNKLTWRSSKHINAAIKESKTVKYLNLGSNDLMDSFIIDISNSLSENKVLLKLDLRATKITCLGVSELAEMLRGNDTLEILDLRDNPIYKMGLQSLLEALMINQSITEINVDKKPIEKRATDIKTKYTDFRKQLISFCEKNKELVKLAAEIEEVENDDSDEKDESIFGEDDLDELEEPQEELPKEYQRYMKWKI